MKRLSSLVCTAAVVLAAGCSTPTDPVNATMTLAPGQTGAAGSLSVKFIGVTIDTRCPANALCIQAGDAYIALEASVAATQRSFELQVLNPTNRETEVRGYLISVDSLSPYPFAPDPIAPEDYRVTLHVTR